MELKAIEGVIDVYFPYNKEEKKGGYGFIIPEDKIDVPNRKDFNIFFHSRDSSIHEENIRKGIRVLYAMTKIEKDGQMKDRAINVRRLVD